MRNAATGSNLSGGGTRSASYRNNAAATTPGGSGGGSAGSRGSQRSVARVTVQYPNGRTTISSPTAGGSGGAAEAPPGGGNAELPRSTAVTRQRIGPSVSHRGPGSGSER